MARGVYRLGRVDVDGATDAFVTSLTDNFRRSTSTAAEGTAGVAVSAVPGRFYRAQAQNTGAAAYWFQVFDKASAPANNDVPVYAAKLPAGGECEIDLTPTNGIACTSGIAIAISSTAGQLTLPASADMAHRTIVYTATNPVTPSLVTLPLSYYVRPEFAVPWVGTATAGASAGRNLVTAGSDPVAGAAVNGRTPGQWDGTANLLNTTVANNVLWTASAGSFFCLFRADSAPAYNATNYWNGNLFSDSVNAETNIGFTSSGVSAVLYAGGYVQRDVACSAAAWHLAQVRYNGSTLSVRVDNGAWSSIACGSMSFLNPSVVSVGRAYGGAVRFPGRILEWGTAAVAMTNAQFDQVYAYMKATYPSAGLP
jgi:hypothetical protein